MEQRKYAPPDGAPRAQEGGEKNYHGPKMVYMSRVPGGCDGALFSVARDDSNGEVRPTSFAPNRPTTTRRTRRPSWRCGYRLLLLEFLLHAPTFSFGTTRGHNYVLPVAIMRELTRPRKKEEATVGNRVLSTLRRQLRYETKQVERNAGKRSCHNKWLVGWFLGARPFSSRMTNCTRRTTHPSTF